ncbi:hypothetical protein VTO42DRAFT_6445 [Malbranchea cinnamomea]
MPEELFRRKPVDEGGMDGEFNVQIQQKEPNIIIRAIQKAPRQSNVIPSPSIDEPVASNRRCRGSPHSAPACQKNLLYISDKEHFDEGLNLQR